jgi:hypothetical protein
VDLSLDGSDLKTCVSLYAFNRIRRIEIMWLWLRDTRSAVVNYIKSPYLFGDSTYSPWV